MRTESHVGLLVGLVAIMVSTESARAQGVCYITPQLAGTLARQPDNSLTFLGPGGELQSTYFRTSPSNREFHRGIIEFQVPPVNLSHAVLYIRTDGGWRSAPVPPDIHVLESYPNADLSLTTADYDRPATFLTTFSTDQNRIFEDVALDVTPIVQQGAGGRIGFRLRLASDPAELSYSTLGEGFDASATGLEIVLPPGDPPCEPEIAVSKVPDGSLVSWIPVANALDYDLAYGSLHALKGYGSYTVSNECAADNLAGTSILFSLNPAPGDAFWFLARYNDALSCRTYGGFPRQREMRDAQIHSCVCD